MGKMNQQPPASPTIKQQVRRLLDCGSHLPEQWRTLPVRKAINAVFPYLYSTDPQLKWGAVQALGVLVARLADDDLEAARNVVRRLIWNLNDESGGIGWGSAEAMGEILANHAVLRGEYLQILLSYTREDGNLLEHDGLLSGALWGLGQVARASAELLSGAAGYLALHLQSSSPMVRAVTVRLLGLLGDNGVRGQVQQLENDVEEVMLFEEGGLRTVRIGELAVEVLERLNQRVGSLQSTDASATLQ